MLLRGSLYIYPVHIHMQHPGNIFPHHRNMGCHLRLLSHNSGIHIADRITFFCQQPAHFLQKLQAVRPLISLISIRKMLADIPQGSCSQQGIRNRMQQHIRIRMSQKPLFKGNIHTANNQLAAFHQLMHIITHTKPAHSLSSSAAKNAFAITISSGVVSLILR